MMTLTRLPPSRCDMRIAYLDTETSHLSPDKAEILEICIILEVDGQVIDTFHSKIKPDPERMQMASKYALRVRLRSRAVGQRTYMAADRQ